jgi:hypothetical protein
MRTGCLPELKKGMVVLVPPFDPKLARYKELHALRRSALVQKASAAGVRPTNNVVLFLLASGSRVESFGP